MKQIDLSNIVEGLRTLRAPAETFEHLQNAYSEGFEALLKAFNCDPNEITILDGAEVTQNGQDYDLSSGWVAYQNEIFEVVALPTFTAPAGQVAVWVIDASYIAEDPLVYSDGSQHNTNVIRRMTIQAGLAGSGLKDWDDIHHLRQLEWIDLVPIAPYTGTIQYAIDLAGNVHVRSDNLNSNAAATSPFVAIPEEIRPPHQITWAHYGRISGSLQLARMVYLAGEMLIFDVDSDIADFHVIWRID